MVGWHILDGADGQLARLTGQASESGKMLDGFCDQLGFISVYVAITLAVQPNYGPWVWLLAAAAAFSHLVQAASLEFQRDMYDSWVHQIHGKVFVPIEQLRDRFRRTTGVNKVAGALFLFYTTLQYRNAALCHELISVEQKTRDQPERSRLGALYREYNLKSVHHWTWLSSNKRTIAIALCCLLKLPLLFFIYELVVLNFVHWLLKRKQQRINRQLVHAITNSPQ